jgi:hypothetical protein
LLAGSNYSRKYSRKEVRNTSMSGLTIGLSYPIKVHEEEEED